MTADGSLALSDALVAALAGDSATAALVGARIYDGVPANVVYPFIALGNVQVIPLVADQYGGSDVVVTLHAWSKSVGSVEAKQLLAAMRNALDLQSLTLSGFRLVSLHVETGQVFLDSDGLTRHGILPLRALVEPAT